MMIWHRLGSQPCGGDCHWRRRPTGGHTSAGREADTLPRGVIQRAGYGQYFRHGLGHSVGLEIHENPRASGVSGAVLQPGMTLTVEPGIYITGWGGVRIEDLVVVRERGAEVVSHAEKRMLIGYYAHVLFMALLSWSKIRGRIRPSQGRGGFETRPYAQGDATWTTRGCQGVQDVFVT